MRRSDRIVPVSSCPVATEGINAVIPALGRSGATLIDSGATRYRSDRDDVSEYRIDGYPFRFAIDGFAQSNRHLLSPLGEKLRAAVRTRRVVDLYAGAGLLPFLLLLPGNESSSVDEIVCVEPDRRNVPFITRNIGMIAPDVNLSAVTGTAEGWLAGNADSGTTGSDSTVLLDPPRGGIDPAVRSVLVDPGADAPDIVYLSCDSAALARDLKALVPRYRIDTVVLIDFFPQTAHIETLVALRPRNEVDDGTGTSTGDRSSPIVAG